MNRSALLGLLLMAGGAFAAEAPPPVGTKIADFSAPEPLTGKTWTLAEAAKDAPVTVIVFTSTGCPVSNAYLPKLASLNKRFRLRGAVFVAINSHPGDDTASITAQIKEQSIPFPVLRDEGAVLADRFNVSRLPTVYVLDRSRTVRYMGRIDDQYSPGSNRAKATTSELEDALIGILDNKEIAVTHTAVAGCKLTRTKNLAATTAGEAVTYHKHVSRIIQAKCQECHRPGEPAPFSLLNYKQARSWAEPIKEAVGTGVMPPWHADAPLGHFRNDRRLSNEQKATLLKWIEQGCPEGNPADAPAERTFTNGWRLSREPDKVLKMNEPVDVPAQYLYGLSGMPYQYVPIGPKFTEDVWIQEMELRPDFRAAIHHIICYIIPAGKTMYNVAGPDFGKYMLAAYVPGDESIVFPPGMAKRIPKGAQLLFEIHYTPMGKPGRDQSSIGIILAKQPPIYESKTDAVFTEKFVIPPGADNHEVNASRAFPKPVTLVAMAPHMHLRGKAFRYDLLLPDGKRTTLMSVPKYDFNWQVTYQLEKPIEIPAGGRIICTAWFDNSDKNPANPDPKAKVRWGEQTWEEMMIGFVEYIEKR